MTSPQEKLHTLARSAIAIVLAFGGSHAWAVSGQIDGFGANTTTIAAGGTVDFTASFSINTSTSSGGGNNPQEPAPVEGYQAWEVNWYNVWSETVTGVQLQAAGLSFSDTPSAAPGGGYANSWSFSVLFPEAGTYTVELSGGWTTLTESYISAETASRDCYNSDPGGSDLLTCSSWTWNYYDNTDSSSYDSAFSPLTLTIQVAAVPEPETLALYLAGLGIIGAAVRRLG